MSGLLDDFRAEFIKPNNTLAQIILLNILVFLAVLTLYVVTRLSGQPSIYELVVNQIAMPSSAAMFIRKPWTLLSYAFVHIDIFHILFNMLFLFWFGRLVEEYLGSRRLIGLYILGAVAGGVAYIAIYNLIPYFAGQVGGPPLVGASAAALAVAVGAATLLPNYTFHLLFFGPVRIKYIVLFFIVLSFAQSVGPNAGGNLAHLGGALLGFVFVRLLQSGTDLGRPIYWVIEGWASLTRPKPAVKVTQRQRSTPAHATSFSSVSTSSAPDQDEIDTILDKIGRSGYDSLTREEKQKLFRASQKS